MKKLMVLTVIIIAMISGLFSLIWYNGNVEQNTVKQKTSVGLSIGSQYMYKTGNRYIKILIEASDMWLVQTEDMNFSEKMNVKELKQIKEGIYLLQFSANNTIRVDNAFIVSEEKEESRYYIVIKEEYFYLVPDCQIEDYDIQEYAENVNIFFVKQ